MADATETKIDTAKADAAAEKAYAAAAAAVEVKAEAKPEAKPVPAAQPVAKKAAPKAAPKAAAKKVAVKAPAKAAPKKAAAKKTAAKKTAAKKTVKPAAKKTAVTTPVSKIKDVIMAQTKKTQTAVEDFTSKFQEAVADAQDRAKAAFEKSNEVFGEYGEFAKGNVEALVESGKILASGIQTLGKDYVAEGKSAIETLTADVKELAAVKSPADFLKLQGEMLRRNFDAAIAAGSKNSEKVVKLANEAFAPIQDRVAQAIEKVKKAA
jgi:phasin family protein